MKIVFSNFYQFLDDDFGYNDGGTAYGNKLNAHMIQLRRRLEKIGFQVLTRKNIPVRAADIVVYHDLNEEYFEEVFSLPSNKPCILICNESPIYAPLSHRADIVFNKRWTAVLTWNRSFAAEHIHYYDIPCAGADLSSPPPSIRGDRKAVVVSSYKRDLRGLAPRRDYFYKELARERCVDVYGAGWPVKESLGLFGKTKDKIVTMSGYHHSLIVENSRYPGYVTEKLADSIIVGIPAIYYGDWISAERRFPGTFVPLKNLSRSSYAEADKEMAENYVVLRDNVIKARAQSGQWGDTFLDTFMDIIQIVAARNFNNDLRKN
jgi:Glycosyltransferase family 10 (fucosyltransferase).